MPRASRHLRRRRAVLRALGGLPAWWLVGCNRDAAQPDADDDDKAPVADATPTPAPEPTPPEQIPPDRRVLIYGATGRVGSRILDEALRRKWWVTAVIHRTPLQVRDEHLLTVPGDVLDVVSVTKAMHGHAAVISAVGGKAPDDDPQRSMALRSAETLVAAARRVGAQAPRVVMVGSSTTLLAEDGKTFLDEVDPPPGPLAARLRGHQLALDFLRSVDDVRWTVATPPRSFPGGNRTGTYRFGEDTPVTDDAGEDRITMEDFAAAIFDELEAGKYIRRRFTVAY